MMEMRVSRVLPLMQGALSWPLRRMRAGISLLPDFLQIRTLQGSFSADPHCRVIRQHLLEQVDALAVQVRHSLGE